MNDVTSDVAMTTDAEHAVKAQFCHHMGTAEKANVNFVLITLFFFSLLEIYVTYLICNKNCVVTDTFRSTVIPPLH